MMPQRKFGDKDGTWMQVAGRVYVDGSTDIARHAVSIGASLFFCRIGTYMFVRAWRI